MVYKIFDKKSAKGSGLTTLANKSAIKSMSNKQFLDGLDKPIIRKFKRRRVYLLFEDNIWGIDLADMQLISKCNKEIRYLLCVIGLFSKYAWVVPLKDKKVITIVNAFQNILHSSKRKPTKICADQGSEIYNSSFKKLLEDNDIKMYSTYNEKKNMLLPKESLELFKIFKHITAASKNVYFDVLHDIDDNYNNTYHTTIKMKSIDVKLDSYAEYNVDSNEKDRKLEVGDHVRI